MRLISLVDRGFVTDYLRRFPPLISELTFTNLYVWRQTRPIFLDEFQGTLLVFAQTAKGLVLLGNPIGQVQVASIIDVYFGKLSGVERFPAALLDRNKLPLEMEVISDRDNADYVYRQADLANLAGRHFTKKRNHINQCLASYDCSYEIITQNNLPECLEMQKRWCAARSCQSEPGLEGESMAIEEALRHYTELALTGGAVRIGGKIQAFTIGEALNNDTAVCHFEKAMPGFHGLAQLINQWFAKFSLDGFTWINREQDLGLSGLRLAKESYNPDHMVEKVKIVPRAADQIKLAIGLADIPA